MDDPGTAPGPGRDADATGAGTTAAAARLRSSGSRDDSIPEQQLRAVISALARSAEMSAIVVGSHDEPLGRALVFWLRPARLLHIVGDSPLAGEFRRLLTAGEVPGWDLHPVPAGHTPLHVLAWPLHSLSGSTRFYNLLERNGFTSVEEVAAMPENSWFELRNCGTRFIAAVRQVIAGLQPDDAQTTTGTSPGPGGAVPTAGGVVTPAGLPADAARALQVMAAWAAAEHGAKTLGDLLTPTCDVEDLPPDVARSWDRIRQLRLRPLAAELPGDDLPRLARELLDELEERRRLILTSRTFAAARRTTTTSPPNSASAASASASSRPRRCSNWPAQPRTTGTARSAGAPYRPHDLETAKPPRSPADRRGWARCCPGWPDNPPDADAPHPLQARPASSALSMPDKAFKASLEPLTPPLCNARRDTGFPAAASLRATARA